MSANDRFFLRKKYLFWFFAFLALCFVFFKIRGVLLPFYIACFVSILFSGFVGKLEKKLRIPRVISSGIITISFYCFLFYAVSVFLSITVSKASKTITEHNYHLTAIGKISEQLNVFLHKYDIENAFSFFVNQLSDIGFEYSTAIARGLLGYGTSFISVVFLLTLTPIVTFMLLKDMPIIKRKFYQLLPVFVRKDTKTLFDDIYESVFKYLEGQTMACIVLSIIYSLALLPIGSNHFILLGIIIGFSAFVPYLGFYLATIITLFSIYHQFGDMKAVITTFVVMLLLQIVDSGFITPKIVGKRLGVHPLFVIFGVLISVPLFGVLGVLLALPLVGVLSVIIKFFVKKYKDSSYYVDDLQ